MIIKYTICHNYRAGHMFNLIILYSCHAGRHYFEYQNDVIIILIIINFSSQAARSGLEKCQAKMNSASSEEDKAEAQIGVELYETVLKALEG